MDVLDNNGENRRVSGLEVRSIKIIHSQQQRMKERNKTKQNQKTETQDVWDNTKKV